MDNNTILEISRMNESEESKDKIYIDEINKEILKLKKNINDFEIKFDEIVNSINNLVIEEKKTLEELSSLIGLKEEINELKESIKEIKDELIKKKKKRLFF